ncbi:eukaryotic elongation factor [Hyaloraphidium curvatum]|nr:eukaryotic elongation factor [Hyaloraphidium curvatum]
MPPASGGGSKPPFNVSIGIMGHVDSGKTSLARALSTVASTAAFDKHPESRRRGITLDLGFSAFYLDPPPVFRDAGIDDLQVTLVDCPGHAAFVRTVIGGSQIIDLMLLVIDAGKGIQTQTAESLVLAEITGKDLVIALNKVDIFEEADRDVKISKVVAKLRKTLADTPFAFCPIVPVAANVGAESDTSDTVTSIGLEQLISTISNALKVPARTTDGSFVFAVDHCFAIKGQGTVMTGTVLRGKVAVGETIELPSAKVTKKIKSMQMFRKPVTVAAQGDRVGLCVSQLDPDVMEKGLAASVGAVTTIHAAIVSVQKVKYFKGPVASKAKFHFSLGHETVLGLVTFFGQDPSKQDPEQQPLEPQSFHILNEYLYLASPDADSCFALVELEVPVLALPGSLYIASKLDSDITDKTCRLAFHGHLLQVYSSKDYRMQELPRLKVFKWKQRTGAIERVVDGYSVIGKGLFKRETVLQPFIGMFVTTSNGVKGVLEGSFGQSGKYKVRFRQGVPEHVVDSLAKKGGPKKANGADDDGSELALHLTFKSYLYSLDHRMVQ